MLFGGPGGWDIPWDCPIIKVVKRKAAAPRKLYVKNSAAHRLAEQISRQMEDKLRNTAGRIDRAKLDALCAEIGALPVLDSRSPDEILAYDATGIPR